MGNQLADETQGKEATNITVYRGIEGYVIAKRYKGEASHSGVQDKNGII